MIETVITCPFGSQCKEIKNNKLHQCAWLVKLAGTNPQTGEQMDEEKCAVTFLPILMVENTMKVSSSAAAVESLRNEIVENQEKSTGILLASAQIAAQISQQNQKFIEGN
jgi:hypothetical protein